MQIELRRIRNRPDSIDGQIWIEGQKVCDCAENTSGAVPEGTYRVDIVKCKQHARKMPVVCLDPSTCSGTESRLEAYTAKRSVTGGNALGLQTQAENSCLEGSTLPPCESCPKLTFVGNNTTMPVFCPQLCPGNGVYKRTDGAIIVGSYLAPGCLKQPKQAFDNLYDRIRKSAERGHQINLIISSI